MHFHVYTFVILAEGRLNPRSEVLGPFNRGEITVSKIAKIVVLMLDLLKVTQNMIYV